MRVETDDAIQRQKCQHDNFVHRHVTKYTEMYFSRSSFSSILPQILYQKFCVPIMMVKEQTLFSELKLYGNICLSSRRWLKRGIFNRTSGNRIMI